MKLPFKSTRRNGNFVGAAACGLLMAYALYAQHVLNLLPCPLCIFQRVAVIGVGLVFLIAAIHNPGPIGARIYSGLLAVVAATGLVVAGRHVWLQSLPPDQVPACGPGLDYMLEYFPFADVLTMVFQGAGECAKIDWVFLGLTMPAWVFIAITGLMVYGLIVNWLLRR